MEGWVGWGMGSTEKASQEEGVECTEGEQSRCRLVSKQAEVEWDEALWGRAGV